MKDSMVSHNKKAIIKVLKVTVTSEQDQTDFRISEEMTITK